MYASLIRLTDTVTSHKAGTVGGAIHAVSAFDIEDFKREELAQRYIEANQRAVANGVSVRRVFLLDGPQVNSPQVMEIMKEHDSALQGRNSSESGVKWLRKTEAGDDKRLDFALFAREVLVRRVHRPGGVKGMKAELTFNESHVDNTLDAFERLWISDSARLVADFEVRGR